MIVTGQEREASAQILNEGARPVLIQAWVDTGNERMAVEHIQAPFIVDPPVFRLDSGQSRRLRILMTELPAALPGDRESVFWFNVMEIPPKPNSAADGNYLQISFRTRLKLFFRPDSIAGYAQPEQDAMRFSMRRDAFGARVLHIENRTPLHQTVIALSVVSAGGERVQMEPDMIAPFQDVRIPLTEGGAWLDHPRPIVRFSTIGDYGVVKDYEQAVSP